MQLLEWLDYPGGSVADVDGTALRVTVHNHNRYIVRWGVAVIGEVEPADFTEMNLVSMKRAAAKMLASHLEKLHETATQAVIRKMHRLGVTPYSMLIGNFIMAVRDKLPTYCRDYATYNIQNVMNQDGTGEPIIGIRVIYGGRSYGLSVPLRSIFRYDGDPARIADFVDRSMRGTLPIDSYPEPDEDRDTK